MKAWKRWRRKADVQEVVVAADDVASAPLVEAVLKWTGFDRETTPKRNNSRLIERFGPDAGARLLSRVKELEDDFYKSQASFTASDVSQMAKLGPSSLLRRPLLLRHGLLGNRAA